jgi:hypothetical protein
LTYLDKVENTQFTLRSVHYEDKVKGGIASVYDPPPFVRVALEAKKALQLWGVKEVT